MWKTTFSQRYNLSQEKELRENEIFDETWNNEYCQFTRNISVRLSKHKIDNIGERSIPPRETASDLGRFPFQSGW